MARFSILLGIILSITISCDRNKQRYSVYHDKSFNETSDVAKDLNLPFCIVLTDSLSITSIEYINRLKSYKTPINNVIYNFANNCSKNYKWYTKLLSPEIYPVTCVFNHFGQLIDLIPGSSKESFTYVNKVIETMQPCIEFHYNQKYDKDKIKMINFINKAIVLKLKADSGHYVAVEIDSVFQILKNPYLLYLKLQNQLVFDEITKVKETAKELLLFDSAQDLYKYYEEFSEANQLLDSTYNYKSAPLIESTPNKIELPECYLNHTYKLDINIINKGKKPLKISDILTSCSCVKLISQKKHIVNSGESLTLKAEFTPDAIGHLFREIYIASNSMNTPIYTVSLNAIVQDK